MKVHKLDAVEELADFIEVNLDDRQKTKAVVTSFNVLTQLKDLGQVSDHDGIHIFPDTLYMRENMSVKIDGNKLVQEKYEDYIHQSLEQADYFEDGYKCVSYFAPAKIDVTPVSYSRGEPFSVVIRDLEYIPVSAFKPTPKYDGILMRLDLTGGEGTLRTRSGLTTKVQTSFGGRLALLLEKLPKIGPPRAFALLRVLFYKSYVPFHGLMTLTNFATKVRFKIGGVRILAPSHDDLSDYDSDGQIYRIGNTDYRYKLDWTVDIEDTSRLERRLAEEYGLEVTFSDRIEGLSEYRIIKRSKSVEFVPIMRRLDKTSETPIRVVVRYITIMTGNANE